MHAIAPNNQPLQPPFEGAYPVLEQLVGLHRFAADLQLRSRHQIVRALAGERQTRRRGRGMEFEEVRLYQAGDDIRSIDWRVTARTQKPHTKLFREEQERPVLLAADLRSPMFFGRRCFKSVSCCALMSLLGWTALANHDRVGGLVFGDQDHRDIRPKRSKHAQLAWLRQLHQFATRLHTPCPAQSPQPLAVMLEKLPPVCRPGSGLYIASDFHDLDSRCIERLHRLARHADVTLLMLYDPLEAELAQLAQRQPLWVTNGQQQRLLSRETDNRSLIEHRLTVLQQQLSGSRIGIVALSTEQPLIETMTQIYRRQPRRGHYG